MTTRHPSTVPSVCTETIHNIRENLRNAQDDVMSDSELQKKRKMISLRLSDQEYAVLKAQYSVYGARNVSDLARLAIAQIMQATAPRDHFAQKIEDLEGRVHALELEFAALTEKAR